MPHTTRPTLALPLLAACLSACVAQQPAIPVESTQRHYNLYFGGSSLSDDFEPLDDASAGGAEFSWGKGDSGLRYEIGINVSGDDDDIFTEYSSPGFNDFAEDVEFESRIIELYGGGRYEWKVVDGHVRPYVGGGLSFSQGSIESSPPSEPFDDLSDPPNQIQPPPAVDEDDESFGVYLHAGVRFPILDGFHIGVDYRTLIGAEYDLSGSTFDGDYDQLAFNLGWTF